MVSSENYVLNHNYGYGNQPEQEKLNKLQLRNVEDLKVYVHDVIDTSFVATYNKNIVEFNDKQKTKVVIESL